MSERFRAGSFEAGGIAFTVETDRADLAARVADVFQDMLVAEPGSPPVAFEILHSGATPPAHPWAVWRDGELRQLTVADDYVVVYLLWEINRLMFEATGERVHLHGAAVVHDGRAVVLAGPSHAGKSTLACWLTHRGWGFLTDEAALVDPETLMVWPYWRPIGVRRPGPLDAILDGAPATGRESAELLVPASTIGPLASAAPLAGIAFPNLAVGATASLIPLSPAATLMELTQHFPGLVAGGRAGFRRLASLVEAVPGYTLRLHDLDEAERTLRTLVGPAS